MKIKIIIYNVFSFIRKMLMDLSYFLTEIMYQKLEEFLSYLMALLVKLILLPLIILIYIINFIIYMINLLNTKTYYFLPSKIRMLVKKQQKAIQLQKANIDFLEKKLNKKK